MNELEHNLSSVQERIAAAAGRVGRNPGEVVLVAVTKLEPPDVILAAYDLGLRHFGENRIEEAQQKVSDLPADITWHMIGHIQSRKAREVLPLFDWVHSVDRTKIAHRLERFAADRPEPLPILLECNVSGESSKHCFAADRWAEDVEQGRSLFGAIEEIVALPHLQVQGLMTMAPIVADAEQARPVFVQLRGLRDELATSFPQAGWQHLSMGMTDDFEVAIEEGATLVRVGRAIFAPDRPAWCAI
jgi:pyridoxal phosphate enzyme (YggS family)